MNNASLDEDMPFLLEAIRSLGGRAEAVVWDDASVDWRVYDAAVVRSTWDYPGRRDEFLRWARHASARTKLWNPEPALRWNTDKHYLQEFENAGIQIVPTQFIEPGEGPKIRFNNNIVVKPAISAGSRDTARHGTQAGATEHIRKLLDAGRSVMVQPYMQAMDDSAETALVYIDGKFSHAFKKSALLKSEMKLVEGLFAQEEITSHEPTGAELEFGNSAVAFACKRFQLFYSRVDMVPDGEGRYALLEFEACEPSLYFRLKPESSRVFAATVLR